MIWRILIVALLSLIDFQKSFQKCEQMSFKIISQSVEIKIQNHKVI